MAGYSGKPLVEKLGLKPSQRLALVGAPGGFARELEPLPAGVRLGAGVGAGVGAGEAAGLPEATELAAGVGVGTGVALACDSWAAIQASKSVCESA